MVNYYSYGIYNEETIYGPGVRFVIWLQGCSIKCMGCSSTHLWSKTSKYISNNDLIDLILKSDIDGVTFLGGEPLEQSIYPIVKTLFDLNKSIICFTGYELEELNDEQLKIKDMCDFFICGRFIKEEINLNLQFRGSNNQRVFKSKKYEDYQLLDNCNHSNILNIDEDGNISIVGFKDNKLDNIIKDIIKEQ